MHLTDDLFSEKEYQLPGTSSERPVVGSCAGQVCFKRKQFSMSANWLTLRSWTLLGRKEISTLNFTETVPKFIIHLLNHKSKIFILWKVKALP